MQALVLLLVGVGVLRITLFGDLYLRYVKEGLRPFLISAGVLLVLTALAGLRDRAPAHAEHDDHHGHDHSSAPRVAWLLVPPALAMLAFAPPALGSYTAQRESAKRTSAESPGTKPRFAPLPKSHGPVPMTLTEYLERSGGDPAGLRGRTVTMTGFATPDRRGWELTRLVVSCCAADSQSLKVRVRGAPAPPADQWVTVVGTAGKSGALKVTDLKRISQPPNPYMDAVPPSTSPRS